MTDLEDRLSSLFNRTAESIEVRPDLDRVLEPSSVIPLSAERAKPRRRGSDRRRWFAPVAAVTAAAACVVIGALAIGGDDVPTVDVDATPAGPTVERLSVPRFLIGAPGWQVHHIEEFSGDEYGGQVGEMTFVDGSGRSVSLNWYPADRYDEYVDRQGDSDASSGITVDGRDALLFESGSATYALWLEGNNTFELRGDNFPSMDDYRAMAASIHEVDEATWLAALPEDVVRPDERPAAVDAVLAQLPVPDNVDVDALRSTVVARDLHGVTSDVTNAVICGWVQQWVDGTESGDTAAVDAAAAAMASSREWPPLVEAAGGPWTDYIWDVADAMTAGVPLEQYPSLPQGTGYQRHVGCPET